MLTYVEIDRPPVLPATIHVEEEHNCKMSTIPPWKLLILVKPPGLLKDKVEV